MENTIILPLITSYSAIENITFKDKLEFDCLIHSINEDITQNELSKPVTKKKKRERQNLTIEEKRLKNAIAARKSRLHKIKFKKLLEEKVIQLREIYESLFGHKFIFTTNLSPPEFIIEQNIPKRERFRITSRKCRYNKKIYIKKLEEEVKQLQNKIYDL